MENLIRIILLFILWTIFWSFWWVLISRNWDKEWIKSIFFGRSKCDNCKKTLSRNELIPIASFVVQHGKCKNCGTKLSNFYRIIEIVCWITFVFTYLYFPYSDITWLIFWLVINRWLTLLIIFDIKEYELHMPIRIFTTILAAIFAIYKFPTWNTAKLTLTFVITFLAIYLLAKLYVRIRFKTKWEWFWLWDVYLSITIWLLSIFVFDTHWIAINPINIINILLTFIIVSCLIGLIYTLLERILSHRKDIKIPFLPAMICGFWLLILFGDYFINIFS